MVSIRAFEWDDYEAVVRLWVEAGLTVGPSESRDGLQLKLERDPELFLVAAVEDRIAGAVLGAFDGRRGWIYHLAVHDARRRQGVGRALLEELEARLRAKGCRKVNLLVAAENRRVVPFYESLGYRADELVFMEKWLEPSSAVDPRTAASIDIRLATESDLPFLASMLVEAAYPPWAEPKPTAEETLAEPRTGRYLTDWGRPGDLAWVAEEAGLRVGAAWYRRFSPDQPGHGFVSSDVPELAIAVVESARGQGVGRRLLEQLVGGARAHGEHAVSLSVSTENEAAVKLYRSLGFTRVGGTDANPTLLLELGR